MVDDKQLLQAFDTMCSGVYIITSSYRRKTAGCTATWVNRASFDPPLICVHMQPKCHTLQTVESSKRLCINVLDSSSLELARRFGFTSGHTVDKLSEVGYRRSPNGSPVLDAAVSYLDCRVKQIMPVGDHMLVVAQVLSAAMVKDCPPLLYDPNTFYPSLGKRVETLCESEAESSG